jgi:hypothetical protein
MDKELKKNLFISVCIGGFMGLFWLIVFFIFGVPSSKTYLNLGFFGDILFYSFIQIPGLINEQFCEIIDSHTFGCVSYGLVIFPLFYASLLPFVYYIYYKIRHKA